MRLYERAHFPDEYASSSELYAGIDEFRRVVNPQPGDVAGWPGHAAIPTGVLSTLVRPASLTPTGCGNTEPHEPAVEEFVPDVSEESSSKTGLSKTELAKPSSERNDAACSGREFRSAQTRSGSRSLAWQTLHCSCSFRAGTWVYNGTAISSSRDLAETGSRTR